MKDNLEKFILENRESFDTEIPDREAWKKIKKRRQRPSFNSRLLKFSIRAAAMVFIFFLSYAYHEYRDNRQIPHMSAGNENEIYEEIPELKETEKYYSTLVSEKMEELQPYLIRLPEIREVVEQDLSELDSVYVSLKNDLKDNIANDKVIEAMIQNYRLKLEILEELLKEVKNENNENKKPAVRL
jgi:hypothetical protein